MNQKTGNWLNFYQSSLGKKIITGITGFGLTLFVLIHMLGNLTLLNDRDTYNQLGHLIENLSFLVYGLELVLLVAIIFHIVVGISIRLQQKRSRPVNYRQFKSSGKPSKQSLSSRSMAITGIVVLIFLVWHLLSFKFGTYYATNINGVPMRDLSRLVIEKFHNPFYTLSYLIAIALLGFHLRHGIWSAGQSLGLLESNFSSLVYQVAGLLAVIISLGFMILPLGIYYGLIPF